jgi:DNA-binding NtrC family response regulator
VFVRDFCNLNNLPPRQLTEGARERLREHAFPGNVRELKAVVELAAVLAESETIQPQHLSLRGERPGAAPLVAPGEDESLRSQTAAIVQRYLQVYNGNILQVADRLQIGKSTIYRMLQNKQIELP